ncbi:helix-turn-helix transcriptional regulator [Pseudomonas violetae]|uniref:WYL domain-containing protein n=1 Tax=Pseudomonas violetae TaxID=2915813 RepID=A0ABT0ETU6_9PSED|nr:WYL domain-containing protein [Pseudomonas violetae]MCK1788891.1 WYL domain-containing protein [Pseudomonas violetae]
MAVSKYNAPDRDRRRKTLRDLLKKAGGAISTEALHVDMVKAFGGFSVRTTRRDLEFLAGKPQFAVRVELPDRRRRYWKLGRGSLDLALTPPDAMTLTAILQHADRFGFRIESDQLVKLRNYAATEVWSRSERNMIAEGRITSGTRFMVLKPGDYNADHLITIQSAMEDDQSLKIVYRPRDSGGAETCLYYLKPLALSYQDSNVYLSAYVAEETWPEGQSPAHGSPRGKYSSNGPGQTCVLMLHRIEDVQTHLAEIPDPPGYDVHSIEVQKDLMTIHGEKDISLELRLSDNLQNRLSENPLTDEQVLIKTAQGWSLKCQVRDSQGLRLFLLSNAADIQVVAPASLRNYIYGVLKEAIAKYSQD